MTFLKDKYTCITDKIRLLTKSKAQCLIFANCAYFVKIPMKRSVLKRCRVIHLPRDLTLRLQDSDQNLKHLFQS